MKLGDAQNITPQIEEWLAGIGIESRQEFEELGAETIYTQLVDAGHKPDSELYFRLLGAERNIDWHILAQQDSARAESRFSEIDEP